MFCAHCKFPCVPCGASKASAYPLVSRETAWHTWEFAVRAEHQRLPAGFTSCMRAIRFPYLQGGTPTPLTPRNSHEKRRRPPGLFFWHFRTPPQPPCEICRKRFITPCIYILSVGTNLLFSLLYVR